MFIFILGQVGLGFTSGMIYCFLHSTPIPIFGMVYSTRTGIACMQVTTVTVTSHRMIDLTV